MRGNIASCVSIDYITGDNYLFQGGIPYSILRLKRELPIKDGAIVEFFFRDATPREWLTFQVAEVIQHNHPTFNLSNIPTDDPATFRAFRERTVFDGFPLDQEDHLSPSQAWLLEQWSSDESQGKVWASVEDILQDYAVVSVDYFWQYEPELFEGEENREDEDRKQYVLQEEIMEIFHQEGGLELADGYDFFCAVKNQEWRKVDDYRRRFLEYATQKLGKDNALTLINHLESDAQYALCKCHALREAITIYQVVYLKTHFPRQFHHVMQQQCQKHQ
jgi:hypothetical protein